MASTSAWRNDVYNVRICRTEKLKFWNQAFRTEIQCNKSLYQSVCSSFIERLPKRWKSFWCYWYLFYAQQNNLEAGFNVNGDLLICLRLRFQIYILGAYLDSWCFIFTVFFSYVIDLQWAPSNSCNINYPIFS